MKVTRELSLVQKVIELIRNDLITQTLKPGNRLPPQDELVEEFGVSRTVVREAITMLTALGVVESKQGKGTFIKDRVSDTIIDPLVFSLLLEKRTPDDFLELRQMIELGMLPAVIKKADADDISRMKKAIEMLEKSYEKGVRDRDVLCEYDLAFHYAFGDSTRNPLLIRIGRTVWEVFRPSIAKAVFEVTPHSIASHKDILRSIRVKNLMKGMNAINKSLDTWKRYTLDNGETSQ